MVESKIAEDIWDIVKHYVPLKNRKHVARKLHQYFNFEVQINEIGKAEQLCRDAMFEYDEKADEWIYR